MSMRSDVRAKLTSNLHAEAGTRWSLILKHQNLPTALLQKNLWISGNLPPEPGLCSSWQASSVCHVRSLEVIVQRRLRIGGGREGGKARAPTSCLDSLADPAREDRHMVARNLLFSLWPTTKTGKKATAQDRIMHFPLSVAISDTLVCYAEPMGNTGGKIVYHTYSKKLAKTHARVLLRHVPPKFKILPKCCCCIQILDSLWLWESCDLSPLKSSWKNVGHPCPLLQLRQVSSFLAMMSRGINRQTVHSPGLLSWHLRARITMSLRVFHRPTEVEITWPNLGMHMWWNMKKSKGCSYQSESNLRPN